MTIDHEGDISALLARHDYYPLRIDSQRNAVVFVQMSRETLRRSSFLDQRAIPAGPGVRIVDIDALFERLPSKTDGPPAHFILHGAFCGSTLLARHFEELPHCLVLKEPQLLSQIARLGSTSSNGNTASAAALGSRGWADWLDPALSLLSRTDARDAAVLIKASDQVNWLATRLLDRDPKAKIIYLCAPLRVFLLSALKSEERREWLRSRARGLRSHLAQVPLQDKLVADELTDGQVGAALWLLNSFLCSQLLARPDSDRILVMSSEDLVARQRDTFHAAAHFLGLTHDEDIRRALDAFRPIDYYSKEPDVPVHFDAARRDAALAKIDDRFGGEVDAAILWATRMSSDWLPRSPFPFACPELRHEPGSSP